MSKHPSGYVVYGVEHLRDGREEFAKAFGSLDAALAWINETTRHPFGQACQFRLFELGKEIPLRRETVEEPQPPKTTTRFTA